MPAQQLPRLAKYELLEEIGHGGMAVVYRARDRRLDREVAVKVIHRHLRQSNEVARRFADEARAVAKLKHPNIVEIYDVADEDAPDPYLVAELVRGKSLRKLLTTRPVLPAELAACIGVELASALVHAHERGVVHRDVKPENVLFGLPWSVGLSEGSSEPTHICVKLTDFGIAKLLDQQRITATNQVLGSPAYMAPEQLESGDIDARTDVFSLGVLLYECMVGHPPFEGKTPGQVLKNISFGRFSPADRERPEIGSRWAEIIHQAIANDPAQRSTMHALKAALEEELRALGITDGKAELTRFFRGHDEYEAALARHLVPALLDRGSRALRQRDRVGAAAHINRAAALAPADPHVAALLKTLIQADHADRWRRHLAVGAAAVLVVGAVAVAARRVSITRDPPPAPPLTGLASAPSSGAVVAPPPASSAASAAPEPPPPPSATAAPSASTISGHRLATPSVGPRASASSGPAAERFVQLSFYPPSTHWRLDGGDVSRINFAELWLPVGSSHKIEAFVLDSNPCCEKRTHPFVVQAGAGGQVIHIDLPMKPGKLVSRGPVGFYIDCVAFGIDKKPVSGTYTIKTDKTESRGRCVLLDGFKPVREQTIVIQAGLAAEVSW